MCSTTVVVVGTVAAMFRSGPLDYVPDRFENPLAVRPVDQRACCSRAPSRPSSSAAAIGVAAQLVRMRRAYRRRAHPAAVAAARRVRPVRLHDRLDRARPAGHLQRAVRRRLRRRCRSPSPSPCCGTGSSTSARSSAARVVFSVLSGLLLIAYAVVVGLRRRADRRRAPDRRRCHRAGRARWPRPAGSGPSGRSTGCSTASGATRSPSPPASGRRSTRPPPPPRRCRRWPTRSPGRCGCPRVEIAARRPAAARRSRSAADARAERRRRRRGRSPRSGRDVGGLAVTHRHPGRALAALRAGRARRRRPPRRRPRLRRPASSPTSRPAASGSWPGARRSAVGCGTTCTTGSARRWPAWRCSSSRWPAGSPLDPDLAARAGRLRDQMRAHRGRRPARGGRPAPAGARRARAGRGAARARRRVPAAGAAGGRRRRRGSRRPSRCRRCAPPSRSRPTGSRPRRSRNALRHSRGAPARSSLSALQRRSGSWSRSPTTARGAAPTPRPGVGMVSMRERAAELGGTARRRRRPRAAGRRCGPACRWRRAVTATGCVIVDDHPVFRAGVVDRARRPADDIDVVGAGRRRRGGARRSSPRLPPDVVADGPADARAAAGSPATAGIAGRAPGHRGRRADHERRRRLGLRRAAGRGARLPAQGVRRRRHRPRGARPSPAARRSSARGSPTGCWPSSPPSRGTPAAVPLPGAHRPRARGARPGRARAAATARSPRLFLSGEDRAQPGVRRAHQAARGQPRRGRGAGPRRRPGPRPRRGSGAAAPGAAGAARARRAGGRAGAGLRGDRPQVGRGDQQRHREDGDGERATTVATSAARSQPWATPVTTSSAGDQHRPHQQRLPAAAGGPAAGEQRGGSDEQQHRDADQQHPAAATPETTATTRAAAPPATAAAPRLRARAASRGAHGADGRRAAAAPRGRRGTDPARRAAAARRRRPRGPR